MPLSCVVACVGACHRVVVLGLLVRLVHIILRAGFQSPFLKDEVRGGNRIIASTSATTIASMAGRIIVAILRVC